MATINFAEQSAGGGALNAAPVAPQAGIEGGGVTPLGSVRSGAGWFDSVGGMTTELGGNLPGFIESAFAPALEATKRKREWEGFTAARAGKTMEEITEDKPWYSKLFGPNNYEIGAMTFTAQKQVHDIATDMLTRMPELRKLSPQQFAEELNNVSEGALTGNSYTDAILRKSFMDQAGPLTDLYTKERMAWEQTEQLRMQVDVGSSAMRHFHNMSRTVAELGDEHPDSPQAAAQLEEAKLMLADALTPSEFQTDESRAAMYTAVVRNAAREGNWFAVNQLVDFGYRDALSIEEREVFDAEMAQARSKWLAERPIDDPSLRDLAQWTVESQRGILSAEQSTALAMDINRRHTARTGDTKPLIPISAATSTAGSALGAYYSRLAEEARAEAAAREAASTEAQKEALRQQKINAMTTAFKSGTLGVQVTNGLVEKGEAEAIAMASYTTDPAATLTAAVRGYAAPYKFVSERLKEAMQAGVPVDPNSEYTPGFGRAYQEFKLMENQSFTALDGSTDTMSGYNAAATYFGPERVELFRYFEENLGRGMEEEVAYAQAQKRLSSTPVGQGDLSKEQAAKLDDALDPSSWFGRMFGGQQKLKYKGVLRGNAMREFNRVRRANPDKDDEWVARAAVQSALAQNTDMAGEYTWDRRPGQAAITAYAKEVSPDVFSNTLRTHLQMEMHKADIKTDGDEEVFIVRTGDRNGIPNLLIFAQDTNGNVANIVFGSDQFKRVQQEAIKIAEQGREAITAPGYNFMTEVPVRIND